MSLLSVLLSTRPLHTREEPQTRESLARQTAPGNAQARRRSKCRLDANEPVVSGVPSSIVSPLSPQWSTHMVQAMAAAAQLALALALLASSASASAAAYNRTGALAYAHRFFDGVNHDCATDYTACSPFGYWGGESCGYPSRGGDCANFVSQSLVAGGGHAPLVKAPCRGYPCGVEEVGAEKLGACLAANYGWRSTCGAHAEPPADIEPGDVLLFHGASCDDTEAQCDPCRLR